MNENREERINDPRNEKLPYTQPQLVKHGKVEAITKSGPPISTSQPIYTGT